MRRAVATMVAVGDRLMFLFGDPGALEAFGATGAAMRVRPRALSLRQWAQSAKTGAALKISAGLA
jgi:class 3 adenylate cyclase